MIRRALPVALTVTALAVAAVGGAALSPPALAQTPEGRSPETEPGASRPRGGRPWDQQAEFLFRLGKGTAAQLMTEQEWQEHQAKMRGMPPGERQRYRQDVHDKMMERARDKGISLPEAPTARGSRGPASADRSPGEAEPGRSPGRRPWEPQAEQMFRLGKGLGAQLMTEEEWEGHQAKMRGMPPGERQRYRQDVHDKMMERARDKGISLPEAPTARGSRGPASADRSPGEAEPGRSPGRRPWEPQAEQMFRLGKGLGAQLMTEEEWQAHQAKMSTMSPAERNRYREEVHDKLVDRARERGITLPDTPAARGSRAPRDEDGPRR